MIVVIDDNSLNLQLAEAMLRKVAPDKSVRLFSSACQAFLFLKEQPSPVKLALVDRNMPDISGELLCLWVRLLRPGIHTVLATADPKPCPSAHEVLGKPYSLEQLAGCVERAYACQDRVLPDA